MNDTRTGVQRRALIGAGVAVLAFGAVMGGFAAQDAPRRQEISEVQETTSTTPTTEATTTTAAPATTTAPVSTTTTAAPSPQPLEVVVQEHEQRIDDLEATTTTAPATTTTFVTPPTVCYQPDATGDCNPAN